MAITHVIYDRVNYVAFESVCRCPSAEISLFELVYSSLFLIGKSLRPIPYPIQHNAVLVQYTIPNTTLLSQLSPQVPHFQSFNFQYINLEFPSNLVVPWPFLIQKPKVKASSSNYLDSRAPEKRVFENARTRLTLQRNLWICKETSH